MGLFSRSRRPARRPASSGDPVGDALRALSHVSLTRQYDDVEPLLHELPRWIEVTDHAEHDGFDTVVGLHDEIHAYVDPYESGLETSLAEQPGIEKVFHEDREVLHLRTRLALDDVRAAVVRAVVAANLDPRPPPVDPAAVTDAQVDALADAVAPRLEAAGMTRREGPSPAGRYFTRAGGDGFAQSFAVLPGIGELGDGTSLDRLVHVFAGVRVPEAAHPSQFSPSPDGMAPAYCTLILQEHVEPRADVVTDHVERVALPWLEGTRDRAALAQRVESYPELIWPPAERPKHARLLAEWGHPDAAQALLHDIDRNWRSLRSSPDTVAARNILGGR